MSEWMNSLNLIFSAIVAVIVCCGTLISYIRCGKFFNNKAEHSPDPDKTTKKQKWSGYKTLYSPWCIVFMPSLLIVMSAIALGFDFSDVGFFNAGFPAFSIFFSITVYFLLLVLLMQFLRRWLEAKTLVILWMLPGILYIRILCGNDISTLPLKIIYVPSKIFFMAGIIWILGAVAVLGWNVTRHLQFKKEIFNSAIALIGSEHEFLASEPSEISPEMKEQILLVWDEEIKNLPESIPTNRLKLYVSPNVKTPVSIGISQNKTKIVLPMRTYTEQQLHWILRHEFRHIANDDCSNKLFMIFCKSVGWFLPQMWLAAHYAAEDIELGCDELLLENTTSDTRRFYAHLLLQTAGDGRGFTTCLSASGLSMRYRLKQVMQPRKVHPILNSLTVAIMSFILIFTYGMVGFTTHLDTCSDIFAEGNLDDYTITAYEYQNGDYDHRIALDTAKAKEYLETTKAAKLFDSDYNSCNNGSNEWYITLTGPKSYKLTIYEHCIHCYDQGYENDTYYYIN